METGNLLQPWREQLTSPRFLPSKPCKLTHGGMEAKSCAPSFLTASGRQSSGEAAPVLVRSRLEMPGNISGSQPPAFSPLCHTFWRGYSLYLLLSRGCCQNWQRRWRSFQSISGALFPLSNPVCGTMLPSELQKRYRGCYWCVQPVSIPGGTITWPSFELWPWCLCIYLTSHVWAIPRKPMDCSHVWS